MIRLIQFLVRGLFLFGLSIVSNLSAQLVVSNWYISGNTVTFDITGQIQSSVTLGANGAHVLYIGDPGNTGWISSNSTAGSVTNHGGGSVNLETSAFGYTASTGSPADGDSIFLIKDGYANWSKLDSVDATVSLSGGSLASAFINPEDLIVSAGFYYTETVFPNLETQVGYGVASAVPEPSTYAALFGVGALLMAANRRRACHPAKEN